MPLSWQGFLYQKGYIKNYIIEFYVDVNPYFKKLVKGYAL